MKLFNVKFIVYIFFIVMLVGCSKPPVPQIQNDEDIQTVPTQHVLSNELTPQYYRTIIPYVSSPARGLIYQKLSNRYDIDEFELSLMRQSQSYFDTNEVYFQEGQYLLRETVRAMIAQKKTEAELNAKLAVDPEYVDLGLNPTKDTTIEVNGVTVEEPIYLAYLLEQNYVILEGDETKLQGISLGLALNPYQTYKDEAGIEQKTALSDEELIAKGKEIAQEAVDIVRTQEGLENVEIMVGLYILQSESSVIPGKMVAKASVANNSSKIKNWQDVNEQHYLLPDSAMQEIDYDLSNQFSTFKDKVKEYYPHYYGVIGVARYIDNKLDNLEITVNIDFYGLAEKLSFHQLVSQLITDTFSNHYNVTVVVRSTDEIFGIIQRDADQKDVTVKLISWE